VYEEKGHRKVAFFMSTNSDAAEGGRANSLGSSRSFLKELQNINCRIQSLLVASYDISVNENETRNYLQISPLYFSSFVLKFGLRIFTSCVRDGSKTTLKRHT